MDIAKTPILQDDQKFALMKVNLRDTQCHCCHFLMQYDYFADMDKQRKIMSIDLFINI